MTKDTFAPLISKLPALKRRVAYSLAAGAAAGAAATNADAAVVYSGLQNISVAPGNSQNINLNLDAFQDIRFVNNNSGYQTADVVFGPGQLVGFLAGPSNFRYVTALTGGALIDSTTVGPTFNGSLAYGSFNPNAQFNNAPDAFVGLSFPAGGNLYYGWVRVGINNAAKTMLLKDWAYESQPSVGITTPVPEPTALGLLASGALGVAALRRKRNAAA